MGKKKKKTFCIHKFILDFVLIFVFFYEVLHNLTSLDLGY